MAIDIHFHVLGTDKDWDKASRGEALFYDPTDNEHWVTYLTRHDVELQLDVYEHQIGLSGKLTTDTYFEIARRTLMRSKEVDTIVLLALDAVFRSDGEIDRKVTDLWVPNTYLAGRIAQENQKLASAGYANKRFRLGASVSPYRRDWRDRLQEAWDLGACLVKVIPSVMHVDWREVPSAYFQMLNDLHLPLLAHVGGEYAFPEGRRRQDLDQATLLRTPLDAGVTVIAAHCGSPLFPNDPNYIDELAGMMAQYNQGPEPRLWADTSALTMGTRVEVVKKVLAKIPGKYLLHGSDFPVESDAVPFTPLAFPKSKYPKMTWGKYADFVGMQNPLDRDIAIKRAVGFPESALTAGSGVLRV